MISKEEYNSQSYNIEENPAVSELKSNATKYALDICRAYNLDGEVFQFPNSTTNSVFSVGSEQDRQVLKILPYDRLFFGEVSLLKRWSEAGVSVPRVTHKNDDKKIVPYCFFIMDYLPSSEVRVDNYKVSVVDELISNVIEQLKAGHKIQEVSFGWINYHTDQLGDPNWNTTLIKLLEGRGKSLVLQGALSIHDLERISVDVRSLPQIDQSSLLHGDLIFRFTHSVITNPVYAVFLRVRRGLLFYHKKLSEAQRFFCVYFLIVIESSPALANTFVSRWHNGNEVSDI